MKEKSIDLLNNAIGDELAAINQYMYFHFHCDDQGYDLLGTLFKKTAIEEMRHVESIADRILFLKGDIVMEPSQKVHYISDIKEMLAFAAGKEENAIRMYNDFANQCAQNLDSVTKRLFEDIVIDEERHFDQFDSEIDNLDRFGDRYLALQSIERSKTRSAMP
ncbi:bacterioferritin [Sulfurovum lithotrophicum]|uniref:Bacterioferritin n=1 Tax=Sulfurovum lithotrophicum TaxID=206403 RepID=A0A7U4M261_9BACT|nr:bacterioferritin [Sulfurovum lithotrophicum]AKF25499.1 bacterioferritin [Sulfurovum lithotrophicum]